MWLVLVKPLFVAFAREMLGPALLNAREMRRQSETYYEKKKCDCRTYP